MLVFGEYIPQNRILSRNRPFHGYQFLICFQKRTFSGGGLGGTRKGGSDVNVRHSGRDDGRRERGDASRRRSKSRSRDRKVKRSRSRDRKKRSRSRDRKRSRSRDKKRSKRSRSRSRERRRRERENGGGDEVNVKEEPEDTGYDQQLGNVNFSEVNVKQEKEDTEKVAQG